MLWRLCARAPMARPLLLAACLLLCACAAPAPPPAAVKPPPTPKPEQKAERDTMESASQRQVDRSAESSDLSPNAKERLLVAQSYSKQGIDYIERAKQHYASNDFQGVCREFGNADQAMNAAAETLVPVAREIQIKQPETMSTILRSGESLEKDLESGLVLCRQMGFSWGG